MIAMREQSSPHRLRREIGIMRLRYMGVKVACRARLNGPFERFNGGVLVPSTLNCIGCRFRTAGTNAFVWMIHFNTVVGIFVLVVVFNRRSDPVISGLGAVVTSWRGCVCVSRRGARSRIHLGFASASCRSSCTTCQRTPACARRPFAFVLCWLFVPFVFWTHAFEFLKPQAAG